MIGGHALFTTLMLMEWWVKRPKDLLKKDSLYMSVKSNWRILYWRFELPCLSSQVSSWLYGRVHIVINHWRI